MFYYVRSFGSNYSRNSYQYVLFRSRCSYNAALCRFRDQKEEKKMIIVRTMQEVDNIPVKSVVPYVRSLITNILNAYSSNGSIETVGAVYFLEGEDDVRNYQALGLHEPISEELFEYIFPINEEYSDGCIVINNDYAINLIAKSKYFYGGGCA